MPTAGDTSLSNATIYFYKRYCAYKMTCPPMHCSNCRMSAQQSVGFCIPELVRGLYACFGQVSSLDGQPKPHGVLSIHVSMTLCRMSKAKNIVRCLTDLEIDHETVRQP